MEICETSALSIPMVKHLHQSNGYIKRKLRAWRVQKCIALVGADTVLITAWPQSTPFLRGWYRAPNGKMRNFALTNPHGTAFVPKQWLYQTEATGMESSKIYCPSRCRYRTYHCVAKNYPLLMGGIGPRMEIGGNSGVHIPMVPHLHQSNGYLKRKLRAWRVYGTEWKYAKLRPYQSPWYRVCTKAMVISKGSYGHGEFKMYCLSRCRYRTYHCVAANYPVSWGE